MNDTSELTATIRVRMSASDAHYGGYLVNGAHMLSLFGDVATELAVLCDGDEGLLVAYESVEFLAPLYAGDYVEAVGRITKIGRTSRRMEFTVLGDVVNTAARIESSVAQPDQIVISKNTLEKIGDAFQVNSLGGVTLRGRDTELEVFEVLG